jgi:hypothetical protein
MPSPLFLPFLFLLLKSIVIEEILGFMPLREFRRYKGCSFKVNIWPEYVDIDQETFIMEWTVLTIGIITALLGVLTVHLIWGKPR